MTGQVPVHLVAWLKLLCVSADCFNPPRYVTSENLDLWLSKASFRQAEKERLACQ
jgi:hypothetical protein